MGKDHDEMMSLRLLVGELSAEDASRWRARIEQEPDLAARHQVLRAAWRDLDALREVEGVAVPAGWRAGVLARLDDDRDAIRWGAIPSWVRVGAASALAAGVAVGVGLAHAPSRPMDPASIVASRPTLAEAFWREWADETGVATDKESP